MKKVLYVASIYGHFTAFHLPYIQMLQDHFHCRVFAAASCTRALAKTALKECGVACVDIPFHRSPFHPRNFQALYRLRSLIRTQGFDLIHTHTSTASFVCRLAAQMEGMTNVLYTVHGFHFTSNAPRLKRWFYYWLESIASRWTSGVIVINDEDHQNALAMGYPPDRTHQIHGIGVEEPNPPSKEGFDESIKLSWGIPSQALVVVCIGYFRKDKNHRFLLRTWKEIQALHEDTYLVLVGDGRLRPRLERMCAVMGLQRVVFTGRQTDVGPFLYASDLVVSASLREGLSRSIMEAMATGKPVVATDIRGHRDLVRHGETGFLVPPGDQQGMTDSISTLLSDPDLRIRFGIHGSQEIKAYGLERTRAEMEAVYSRYLPDSNR